MIFPVLGKVTFRQSYNENRGKHRHTGVDIQAPKMTPIVAPFSGVIGVKNYSFWITGDNGWRVLGTHLNDDTPGTTDGSSKWDYMFAGNIYHGAKVKAGQLIGYVGDSTDATGPHLHFELHGPKGIRDPFYSLKTSQVITSPRPNIPWPRRKPRKDEELWIVSPRGNNGKALYVLITAREIGGKVTVDTWPNFASVLVPKNELPFLESTKLVGLYISRKGNTFVANSSVIYKY